LEEEERSDRTRTKHNGTRYTKYTGGSTDEPFEYVPESLRGPTTKLESDAKSNPNAATRHNKAVLFVAGVAILLLVASVVVIAVRSHARRETDSEYTRPSQPVQSGNERDMGRWDTPAGREVIRATAREAGVSEEEARKEMNDVIRRYGLEDWANGKE